MDMCSATLVTLFWASPSWVLFDSGNFYWVKIQKYEDEIYRSYKNKQLIEKFTENELGLYHPKHTGIPESYGIFYAMGAALMFEGKINCNI